MFTPADINVNEIELNKYSLEIQQKTIENKYNFLTKSEHIQKAAIVFLILIIIYGIFSVCILIVRKYKDFGFISLGIFFLMLLLWFVTLSEFYKKSYYGYTRLILILATTAKIALDWVGNPIYINLGAVLVPHITSINLNLGVIFVIGNNVAYFISYFVRFPFFIIYLNSLIHFSLLCIYYQQYPMNYTIDDVDLISLFEFQNKLIIFYSVWNCIIYTLCINLICLYGLYKVLPRKSFKFN